MHGRVSTSAVLTCRCTGKLTEPSSSDYTTGKVMSSIKEMLPAEVEVLRNGSKTSVDAKDLVLGDLVR
jgi:magnesium-transporting ATPase (P-type)